jgi:branched-chain amino acid transport system substrate-binding protein
MIKLGAQLAMDEGRARFEAAGYRLEFLPQDDQASPDVGVAVARRLVNDPDVLAVIGHYNSGVAIPSSEVYKDFDLPMVSPANTHPRVTDRGYANVSRVCGRDDVQGPVGAEFAVNELKARRIFVLHDKTAYGQGVAADFRKKAEALGAEVVAFAGTEERSNFQSVILQIRALQPDLVYFGGIYDQAGLLLKQLREKNLAASFMGPDGCDSSEMVQIAGPAVDGFYYTTVAGPADIFPAARQFAERFRERFGKAPESYALYAYDSANVILKALDDAITAGGAKPSRAELGHRIRATTWDGITGPIAFNANGDRVKSDYYVMQIEGRQYPGAIRKVLSAGAP